jgi:DNA-binding transcriptional regulator/RsmH inhibitor MraZ
MFRGGFESTIDSGGRIDLSRFFFAELKKHKKYALAIPEGEKCLFLHPVPYKKTTDFPEEQISFSQPATICEGILVIPRDLMKYAGLKKKVFLIGCEEKVEIWDEKMWMEFVKRAEKDFKKLSKTFKWLRL